MYAYNTEDQLNAIVKSEVTWGLWKALLFLFCSVNLVISIVLSITTPPGYIPEDTEWDMPEISENASNKDKEDGTHTDTTKEKKPVKKNHTKKQG